VDIGEMIKQLREEKDWTQWDLAIECGKHGRTLTGLTIRNYELGITSPPVKNLEAICAATGRKLLIYFHKQ